MAGVLEKHVQHIARFQAQGGGVAAGVAAEPLTLDDRAVEAELHAVLGVVHQTEHGRGARLYAQQRLQILRRGEAQARRADLLGEILRQEGFVPRQAQQIERRAVARREQKVLADVDAEHAGDLDAGVHVVRLLMVDAGEGDVQLGEKVIDAAFDVLARVGRRAGIYGGDLHVCQFLSSSFSPARKMSPAPTVRIRSPGRASSAS